MSQKINLPDGKVRRKLIGQLLNNPKTCVWPLEMKMINRLFTKVNDAQFWDFFSQHHKFNSLLHLVGQNNVINSALVEYEKFNKIILKKPELVEIPEGNKVGSDIIIQTKPKTLKDFIK